MAAQVSPAGPRAAGKYGLGLLSIGATTAAGFDVLGLHWDVMEERSAHYGVSVDRNAWRLVGLMHIAESREQAYRDVEHGIEDWFDYFQHTAAFPQMDVGTGTNVREFIDFVNDSGLGTVGTPDDACEQIERLVKHPEYGRYVRRRSKFKVHDEKNECKEGDIIRFMETRPLSKEKRWRFVEFVERAK